MKVRSVFCVFVRMRLLYAHREQMPFHSDHYFTTIVQNGQTKHWLWRQPFAFFASFVTTIGSATCLYSIGLQPHN